MWKVYDDGRTTDDGQRMITIVHLSLRLRCTNKKVKIAYVKHTFRFVAHNVPSSIFQVLFISVKLKGDWSVPSHHLHSVIQMSDVAMLVRETWQDRKLQENGATSKRIVNFLI